MKTFKIYRAVFTVLLMTFAFALPVFADDVSTLTKEDLKDTFKNPGYSPYAGRAFPTRVYWGDTHLHTSNSLDAVAFGVRIGPEEAFRLARGEEITATHGERVKLSRPLDWLVVADHSDGIGAMLEIVAGNPTLLKDPTVRDWHNRINKGGDTALAATMDVINSFALGKLPEAQTIEDLEKLASLAKEIKVKHIVYSTAKIVQPRGRKLSQSMRTLRNVYESFAVPEKLSWRGGSWRLPYAVSNEKIIQPFLEICQKKNIATKFCKQNLIETP